MQNGKSPNIVQLMEGKLQYKIERVGTGETVQSYNSPLVRLKARYLNGKSFGNNADEIPIVLEETIPGFRLGLIGMKEGEVRTLYVHPELGYGLKGQLSPNALLIFEVEVLRADSTSSRDTVASSDENHSL
jgi:peptidylprolyl isomerase